MCIYPQLWAWLFDIDPTSVLNEFVATSKNTTRSDFFWIKKEEKK